MPKTRFLTTAQARRHYDRSVDRQDRQAWYADPAAAAMIPHAGFGEARAVFELGCGAGRLAAMLLAAHLPAEARYVGVDLSGKMIERTRARLEPFGKRATAHRTDGSMRIKSPDAAFDRVISTYVLDLLPDEQIVEFIAEAHRVLRPLGLLCVVGLSEFGRHGKARLLGGMWRAANRWRPQLVGGCRPLNVADRLLASHWHLRHREVVKSGWLSSEVVIAARRQPIDGSAGSVPP